MNLYEMANRLGEQEESIYALSEVTRIISPVLSRYARYPIRVQLIDYSELIFGEIVDTIGGECSDEETRKCPRTGAPAYKETTGLGETSK